MLEPHLKNGFHVLQQDVLHTADLGAAALNLCAEPVSDERMIKAQDVEPRVHPHHNLHSSEDWQHVAPNTSRDVLLDVANEIEEQPYEPGVRCGDYSIVELHAKPDGGNRSCHSFI